MADDVCCSHACDSHICLQATTAIVPRLHTTHRHVQLDVNVSMQHMALSCG